MIYKPATVFNCCVAVAHVFYGSTWLALLHGASAIVGIGFWRRDLVSRAGDRATTP